MNTENKLPEDFKQRWVAALRSGEYKQGHGVMYDSENDSLCCLAVAGVLCGFSKDELRGVKILNLDEEADEDERIATAKAIKIGYPNLLIRKGRGSTAVALAQMNDDGNSFSEIADYIEKNL